MRWQLWLKCWKHQSVSHPRPWNVNIKHLILVPKGGECIERILNPFLFVNSGPATPTHCAILLPKSQDPVWFDEARSLPERIPDRIGFRTFARRRGTFAAVDQTFGADRIDRPIRSGFFANVCKSVSIGCLSYITVCLFLVLHTPDPFVLVFFPLENDAPFHMIRAWWLMLRFAHCLRWVFKQAHSVACGEIPKQAPPTEKFVWDCYQLRWDSWKLNHFHGDLHAVVRYSPASQCLCNCLQNTLLCPNGSYVSKRKFSFICVFFGCSCPNFFRIWVSIWNDC